MRKLGIFASFVLLAACSKDIQTTEAVRQGVLDYLQQNKATTGVDPDMLQLAVSSVSFEKDQARATVAFSPKNAPGAGGMTMTYVLNRDGGKWVVKGRQAAGANPHGAQALPTPESQSAPAPHLTNPHGGELPGANSPGGNQSGANQSGANQSGANQSGANQSGANQSGANQ